MVCYRMPRQCSTRHCHRTPRSCSTTSLLSLTLLFLTRNKTLQKKCIFHCCLKGNGIEDTLGIIVYITTGYFGKHHIILNLEVRLSFRNRSIQWRAFFCLLREGIGPRLVARVRKGIKIQTLLGVLERGN